MPGGDGVGGTSWDTVWEQAAPFRRIWRVTTVMLQVITNVYFQRAGFSLIPRGEI